MILEDYWAAVSRISRWRENYKQKENTTWADLLRHIEREVYRRKANLYESTDNEGIAEMLEELLTQLQKEYPKLFS